MFLLFSIREAKLPPDCGRKELFILCGRKELFIRVFRDNSSACSCASYSLGFEGVMLDLTVFVPDQCFSTLCRHYMLLIFIWCRSRAMEGNYVSAWSLPFL